jgi:hypothetical protein
MAHLLCGLRCLMQSNINPCKCGLVYSIVSPLQAENSGDLCASSTCWKACSVTLWRAVGAVHVSLDLVSTQLISS